MSDLPKPPADATRDPLPPPPAEAFEDEIAPMGRIGEVPPGARVKPGGSVDPIADFAGKTVVPAAIIGAAGTLAGPAAIPARIAVTGALSRARGEDWWNTVIDMAGALVGEGVMSGVGAVASRFSGLAKSLASLGERISKGPDAKANADTLKAIVTSLRKAKTPVDRDIAVNSASEQLSGIGKGLGYTGKNDLGALFNRVVSSVKATIPGTRIGGVVSPGTSSAARGIESSVRSPVARGAVDAVAGRPPFSSVALGAALKAGEGMRFPGARHAREEVEITGGND